MDRPLPTNSFGFSLSSDFFDDGINERRRDFLDVVGVDVGVGNSFAFGTLKLIIGTGALKRSLACIELGEAADCDIVPHFFFDGVTCE